MQQKLFSFIGLAFALACLAPQSSFAQQQTTESSWNNSAQTNYYSEPQSVKPAASFARVGIVDTKKCLSQSKLGKAETSSFEKMQEQMGSTLESKQKTLEEIETKLGDDEWIDSVSEEIVNELRRKRKAIRTEGTQLQNQYMQTLQQTQVELIKKLTDSISKASAAVAQEGVNGQMFDVILTEEACTYFSKSLDISDAIIAKMDQLFDKEPREKEVNKKW